MTILVDLLVFTFRMEPERPYRPWVRFLKRRGYLRRTRYSLRRWAERRVRERRAGFQFLFMVRPICQMSADAGPPTSEAWSACLPRIAC